MKIYLLIIFFNFLVFIGNSNLLVTMEIVFVDDCISIVNYQNENQYTLSPDIECDKDKQIADNPIIVRLLHYDLHKIIDVYLKDSRYGGGALMSVTVYLNEYIIKTESHKYRTCENYANIMKIIK